MIATHSPILMAYPDALVYQLSDEGITRIKYEDTEHFVVTRYRSKVGTLTEPRSSGESVRSTLRGAPNRILGLAWRM